MPRYSSRRLQRNSRRRPGRRRGASSTTSGEVYAFVEKYRDSDAVDAHRKSEHFRTIGKAMGALMDGPPTVLRLTAI
ncbi:antibiotic biosynthesis monooxygenase [Cupriavidus sp. BIS7]|uniref:putative quinol monooxygenase n=1 Tax=Cupriavidus sp. BIS7 TaxID=1217718 RepID=UPI0032AF3F77